LGQALTVFSQTPLQGSTGQGLSFPALHLATWWSHLPGPLQERGPRELFFWQWLGLFLLIPLTLLLGVGLGGFTRWALTKLASKTTTPWDDVLARRLVAPITLLWSATLFWVLLPSVSLDVSARAFFEKVLKAVVFASVTWALLRSIDVMANSVLKHPSVASKPASRSLVPLGVRTVKFAFGLMALIAVLSALGLPVESLLAGLGIGGLALALAGQKTVENLFGAFSIGLDQPIREGDVVKIEDIVGTVESIGLRSTRIRTPERTLVTLPNGKLAEMRLETFAARDRLRFSCELALVHGTPSTKLRSLIGELNRLLASHPDIHPEGVFVHFKAIERAALVLETQAYFQTIDFERYALLRDELLIRIMEAVEKTGNSFAFPTQSIHVFSK
jgi:MscS family membrane protein